MRNAGALQYFLQSYSVFNATRYWATARAYARLPPLGMFLSPSNVGAPKVFHVFLIATRRARRKHLATKIIVSTVIWFVGKRTSTHHRCRPPRPQDELSWTTSRLRKGHRTGFGPCGELRAIVETPLLPQHPLWPCLAIRDRFYVSFGDYIEVRTSLWGRDSNRRHVNLPLCLIILGPFRRRCAHNLKRVSEETCRHHRTSFSAPSLS